MVYLYLVILLSLLTIFHIITRYGIRSGRLMRNLPGPTAYPFFGNVLLFPMNNPRKFWETIRRISAEYYPIARLWSFKSAVASVRHPDDLEILLTSTKTIDKGYMYEYIRPWLQNSILLSTGDLVRQRRKLLIPAFHFNILKKYLHVVNEETRKTVMELKRDGKESIITLEDFFSKYTLNVICESSMGVNLRTLDEESINDYHRAIHDIGKIAVYRIPKPYIYDWMMPYIYKWGNLQKNAVKCLHNFTRKLVNERIKYHQSNDNKFLYDHIVGTDSALEDNIGRKKRLCVLDLLLVAKENNEIDLNGIYEEVDTLTFGGHDTISIALVYTLLLLAEHKEEQDKCRAEATELLDNTDGNPQMSDLQKLPYLERCIKESLRLYPSVGTIMRYTREDLQLKHALIPGGTNIFIHICDTHRDPNFWDEPDKFDPDRFLPENCKYRHPFSYIPFSAGPRNCIGQKFAMMELKSLVAQLLYNFQLEPIDRIADIRVTADMVVRPDRPVRIKFISIKK